MIGMRTARQLKAAFGRWRDDDGSLLAAAVAYYAALSFFPLLMVLISGFGFVLQFTQWGQDAQTQVLMTIGDYVSVSVRDNVEEMLQGVQRQAGIGGPVGIFALLFTAAALFAHFERAFDRIWNVESPKAQGIWAASKNIVRYRLRAFLLLLGLGIFILAVFIAGVAFASFRTYAEGTVPMNSGAWRVLETCVTVSLNTGVFCLVFKLLPKVPIRWSEALRGAILTAVIWEIGRLTLTSFVVGDRYSAYGVVGSFIAVMLWIYFASNVLFFGAEYVQVICQECNRGDGSTGTAETSRTSQRSEDDARRG